MVKEGVLLSPGFIPAAKKNLVHALPRPAHSRPVRAIRLSWENSNATKGSSPSLRPSPAALWKAREAIKFMVRLSLSLCRRLLSLSECAARHHFHFHFMEMRSELHVSCCSDEERKR